MFVINDSLLSDYWEFGFSKRSRVHVRLVQLGSYFS